MAKWEMHTYYNEPVNGNRIVPVIGKGNVVLGMKELHGREHSDKDPVTLFSSCSSCHKSFHRMHNEVRLFNFCPNCGERIEGIDESTKLEGRVYNG